MKKGVKRPRRAAPSSAEKEIEWAPSSQEFSSDEGDTLQAEDRGGIALTPMQQS